MKVFEIDTAGGTWDLAPGGSQVLAPGITVTLDHGYAEALVEVGPDAPQQCVTVGGRPLIDVGPWTTLEPLCLGDSRQFVLLAARQAYVPQPSRRLGFEARRARLGLTPITAAADPFVQHARPAPRPRWPRRLLAGLAAAGVVVALAAHVTSGEELTAGVGDAPATPTPVLAMQPADHMPATSGEPAPAVVEAPPASAPVVATARRAAPNPAVRARPQRPALSAAERQRLASQIDSAALVGGYDPARARLELKKLQPSLLGDQGLNRRLQQELGRL